MSRTRVPTLALLAAGAALLSGCASGSNATARQPYAPADGVIGESGKVKVLNALVVAPEDAAAGSVGIVSMTVVNNGQRAERLTAIEADAGTVDYTGPRRLAPGAAVTFGAASNPSATVDGLTARPGEAITLRLTFVNTEPIRLDTVVVPASGVYASITPAPEPTPTVTSTTPVEEPTETAPPSPTE